MRLPFWATKHPITTGAGIAALIAVGCFLVWVRPQVGHPLPEKSLSVERVWDVERWGVSAESSREQIIEKMEERLRKVELPAVVFNSNGYTIIRDRDDGTLLLDPSYATAEWMPVSVYARHLVDAKNTEVIEGWNEGRINVLAGRLVMRQLFPDF